MWAAASADAGAVISSGYAYGNNITYRDITSGNNGAPCLTGYDLCTGRGSWLYSAASPPPQQPSLTISGGGQTLTAGSQSAPMVVSISTAPTSDLTVTLSSTSSTGTISPTSVTIPAGSTTSGSFTYSDSTAGTWTLTASAAGTTSASTTVTVNPASLSTMNVAVSAGAATRKGPNYRVPLTVTATSASSTPVSGASATLTVYAGSTCSGATVATGTATTGTNGTAAFTFSTRQTGTWCAVANVNATGYSTGSGQTTFNTP
jgi:hypothetical protein